MNHEFVVPEMDDAVNGKRQSRAAEARLSLREEILNPEGAPLYQQVYEAIRGQIGRDGDKAMGCGLPTEDQIGAHYEVSKITVRKALQLLERDGFIARRRAKTPLIVRVSREPEVGRTISTIDDIFQHSSDTERRYESYETVHDAEAATKLELDPGASLLKVVTTQHSQGTIIGYSTIYFPPDVAAKLSQVRLQKAKYLIFPVVEEAIGQGIDFADISVTAAAATPHDAEIIGCEPGTVLVRLKLLFRTESNHPVQYHQSYYRADKYSVGYRIGRSPAKRAD